MAEYDSGKPAAYTDEQFEAAMELGLRPIQIICNEPGAQPGDLGAGVAFFAFVHDIPRIGERVELEDGSLCEVTRVYHRVVKIGPTANFHSLAPNVVATKIGKAERRKS